MHMSHMIRESMHTVILGAAHAIRLCRITTWTTQGSHACMYTCMHTMSVKSGAAPFSMVSAGRCVGAGNTSVQPLPRSAASVPLPADCPCIGSMHAERLVGAPHL